MGTTPLSKAQILRSIQDFLAAKSSPPKPQPCRRCGAPMHFLGANFLLSGINIHRYISLPVCPVCEREIPQNLPRPETIH